MPWWRTLRDLLQSERSSIAIRVQMLASHLEEEVDTYAVKYLYSYTNSSILITGLLFSPLKFVQILCFCTLSIVMFLCKTLFCLYFKTKLFEDWILSPSGKTYSAGPNRESYSLYPETESIFRNDMF
jgi:hypothetical protein